MNSRVPIQGDPHDENLTFKRMFPRLLFFAQLGGALLFGLTIVIAQKLAPEAYAIQSPFDAFADILPDQGLRGLDAHGFVCGVRDYNYYNDPAETRCNLRLETGPFSHIEVFYSGGTIQRTDIDIRENALNVGNLVTFLGLTDILPRPHLFFTWHGNVGLALYVNPSDRYGVFQHVSKVTLTNTPPRGREPKATPP